MEKTPLQIPKQDRVYTTPGPGTTAAPSDGSFPRRGRRRWSLIVAVVVLLAISSRHVVYPQLGALFGGTSGAGHPQTKSKAPNIVFILTDDQDVKLGSLNYMNIVQKRIVSEGIDVENHFGTVSLCCPARATLLRGQAAHNTNVTDVGMPGGGYRKFLQTGESKNYLPHWLHKAGYTTAYFGKFFNGYGLNNYGRTPPGWDWTDILVGPYIYSFNNVVMSENGQRPIHYKGWHQIDVLRLKSLQRLKWMISQDKPFYLEIAPVNPHFTPGAYPTIPPARHMHLFPGLQSPRLPNYNPADEYTSQKPAWLGEMPMMNESVAAIVDAGYRARIQALQGVDELVEDVLDLLEGQGILDNTYVIYTTDNGFHMGQHRIPGGKMLPYIEDVNLPFAVRGPGIPAGKVSKIPSTHVDIAPTVLDIAGVPKEDWPPFFDGRSLLQEWKSLSSEDDGVSREILNVEFWGSAVAGASQYTRYPQHNSWKSLRIVSETDGYLFNRWCTDNQTELYDTVRDPYELTNLAIDPDDETKRLMTRLSGLLLVTKSCGQDTCRKPWAVLRADCGKHARFDSLNEAMHPKYDDFFASLPHFGFQTCLQVQLVKNEGPYYPPESAELGGKWRDTIDRDHSFWENNFTTIAESSASAGSVAQRYMGFEAVMRSARPLTNEEIGWPTIKCEAPDYCGQVFDDD